MSEDLKSFLDSKVREFNNVQFIEGDPVSIPHLFHRKEDIEISAFLVSVIAWGRRDLIVNSGLKMIKLLRNSPYDFIMNHNRNDLKKLSGFVHRTFNSEDLIHFIRTLQRLYDEQGGIEGFFTRHQTTDSLQPAIHQFHQFFFEHPHFKRTEKHIPDPERGSAAKRMNLFLRWMVRKDNCGVDFGLWSQIPASRLSCPLDLHSGNVARKLNLITRKQNDSKAVAELDNVLRRFDPADPVKYDFALFGLGISGKIK